ncbi:MAG: helix-hairpin-helix domain-containing protein [Vitreoscilla sp.]|nr:helix-hairpin-helix domain-containing protein [Vitreoscilla sp.]
MKHGISFRSTAMALVVMAAFPSDAVELNRANQAELEMVPGVGPQLSGRILAERAQGRFDGWQDFIARMKGVGPASATRLSAAGLRIGGQAYGPAADPASAPAK